MLCYVEINQTEHQDRTALLLEYDVQCTSYVGP